jgi:hypothetical protein
MGYATSVPGAEPLESVSESSPIRLTREQMVARIMELNTTASADFLDGFSEGALRDYLEHLRSAQVPRGPGARWTRPAGEPGIVSRSAGP